MKKKEELVYRMMKIKEDVKQLSLYIGYIKLLKDIFTSISGKAITWEEGIKKSIDTLSSKEKEVINKRYGLKGKEYTLKEIGKDLGVGGERIRQIEARALRKLKHPIRKRVLLGMSWQMSVQEAKQEGIKLIIEHERKNKVIDNILIDEGNLSGRTINALLRENIETIGELKKRYKEAINFKGIGVVGRLEINKLIQTYDN